MSSIESRIEKLEANKPIDAAAEAAIIMKKIDRACVGLSAEQANAKINDIIKYLPDEVLLVIANQQTNTTEEQKHD